MNAPAHLRSDRVGMPDRPRARLPASDHAASSSSSQSAEALRRRVLGNRELGRMTSRRQVTGVDGPGPIGQRPRLVAVSDPVVVRRCGGTACAPGTCDHRDEPVQIRRAATSSAPAVTPSIVRAGARNPGHPLARATRSRMERHLGHDLGHVRIHTGAEAGAAANAIHARAYTLGSDVVFAPGVFRPATPEGDRLIGHELVHVLQNARRPVPTGSLSIGSDRAPAEEAARSIARAIE